MGKTMGAKVRRALARDWQLLLLAAVPVLYFVIFHYVPMYGVQIAFKDFKAADGIWKSAWCGFKHFKRFFASSQFGPLIKNTLGLSLLQILLGFPVPVLLAIMLNQVKNKRFRKFAQSIVYCPHFISIVVLTGMLYIFLSPRNGIINHVIQAFGGEPVFFLGDAKYFKLTFVISGIWQNAGWNAIIFISALAAIDQEIYEAARVDGASRLQQLFYITLPGIVPTIVIMLILECGRVLNIGFEKVYVMQTDLNLAVSEVISTYTYKIGLERLEYDYATAIGLFNSVISFILLITVNSISKKLTETSLW